MKKSIRLYITGSIQSIFYMNFVKSNAERYNVKGFVRMLEDGRAEIFMEGDGEAVQKMIELCSKGPKHAQIRNVEEKDERFQDLKNFKILHI